MSKQVVFLLICMSWLSMGAAPAERPAAYSEFVSVKGFASVGEAIRKAKYLYFPPGDHVVNNPIVIDRGRTLYLHGGDRMRTMLRAKHPAKPLFIVKKATLINVAGLRVGPSVTGSDPVVTEARNFLMSNTQPIRFEMQECFVNPSVLDIKGPGTFILQACNIKPYGRVFSPVVIDHPQAEFWMFGGNISNQRNKPLLKPVEDMCHLWQKRGRLAVYGTGTQACLGRADFRIDTPSTTGMPHVICDVRSEGANGVNKGPDHLCNMLYVSPSDKPVDVVYKCNAQGVHPETRGRYVTYNAAGTLWFLGNNSTKNITTLVAGNAPKATIVALGNRLRSNKDLLQVTAKRKIFAANVYSYRLFTGDKTQPRARFVNPKVRLADYKDVPPVPATPIPAHTKLSRPRADRCMPGMINIKDHGAKGDGKADDSKAIQAAINSAGGTMVYFPAGTYRITRPIYYSHKAEPKSIRKSGGWFAGAGAEQTVIVRAAGGGSAFQTLGMGNFTIQGITFQTDAFNEKVAKPNVEPCVSLENTPGVGHATQEMIFHDCRFIGGKYALGIALGKSPNCSENMMIDCTFADAKYGLGIGGFNALANMVVDGTFTDNHIAMGHSEEGRSGGTWHVIRATITGTRDKDFVFRQAASCIWYFYGVKSNSAKIVEQPSFFAATRPLFFDHCTLKPSNPKDWAFNLSEGGGFVFLHSQVTPIKMRLAGRNSVNYALKLHSTIPDWKQSMIGKRSLAFELP